MSIVVLYGTETGNAEMLAEDIAGRIGGEAVNMASTDVSVFSRAPFMLVVCSTYGEGELPSTARSLFEALEAQAPDLSALEFAAFSLGDKGTYPDTFARGGAIWAEGLGKRGARQVGALGQHDAASGDLPEEIAFPWVDQILAAR